MFRNHSYKRCSETIHISDVPEAVRSQPANKPYINCMHKAAMVTALPYGGMFLYLSGPEGVWFYGYSGIL